MRIIDPQSAGLTNIEVLAYLTANPPRRPPNPPPNSRNWVPSPDLRDHNTVVKEIHNYVSRLSPHLLKYPRYTHDLPPPQQQSHQSHQENGTAVQPQDEMTLPRPQSTAPTPLDHALRTLINRLQPFGLTKGEVLMIVNLGVGLGAPPATAAEGEEEEGGEGQVEGGGEGEKGGEANHVGGNGSGDAGEGEGGMEVDGEGEGGGMSEEDYGALALLDTVVEEREERLSDEDVVQILGIIRDALGGGFGTDGEGATSGGVDGEEGS